MFPFNFAFQDTFCLSWFTNLPFFASSTLFFFLLFVTTFKYAKHLRDKLRRDPTLYEKTQVNKVIYEQIEQLLILSCRSHTNQFLPPDVNSLIFEFLPPPNDTIKVRYWTPLIAEKAIEIQKKITFWEGFITFYYHFQFIYFVVLTALICSVLFSSFKCTCTDAYCPQSEAEMCGPYRTTHSSFCCGWTAFFPLPNVHAHTRTLSERGYL